MMDQGARIRQLEEENDTLRERIAQLAADLGHGAALPPIFGLTANEERVLGALLASETCSKERIMSAIYFDRHDDLPEIKIIDVFVCKLRRKLANFGVQITTIWGRGYMLSPSMKARAHAMINEARAA